VLLLCRNLALNHASGLCILRVAWPLGSLRRSHATSTTWTIDDVGWMLQERAWWVLSASLTGWTRLGDRHKANRLSKNMQLQWHEAEDITHYAPALTLQGVEEVSIDWKPGPNHTRSSSTRPIAYYSILIRGVRLISAGASSQEEERHQTQNGLGWL